MRTILLSHNKTAYQKVMRAFESADRTCVVHPTGTGKSYLIAAVSESFNRVLILGPNTFVLDQVHSVLEWRDKATDAGKVEYMTYTLLMYKEQIPTGYDLICLDEFHRAGAPEWGDAVDRLLEANPQAKVLGTTATPIRFLDDNRDMADELFGGNIASYMTLKDAWDRDILATPRFVTGLFEFDKVTADIEERISKSQRIDAKEKKVRLTRVNNLRLDWERSQGMPQIIRKHIDKDARRIIVFCGNIEKLKEMEQTVRGWFQKAGIRVASVYQMHAYMPDNELKSAMDGFESDDFGEGGVKLMMSVNMLNEGVHIPRVNAVILLRTTSSKIIYLQQIGRCLTAEKKDKPIILDMVDNITTTNIVHDIKEGFDWYEHQQLKDDEEHEPSQPKDFVVYDYTLGIRQAIDKLVPVEFVRMSYDERITMLRTFCEKNGRLPLRKDNEIDEHRNYVTICKIYPDSEELLEIRRKYASNFCIETEDRMKQLLAFVEDNDRLPKKKGEYDEYLNFQILCRRHKEHPDERLQALIDKYRQKDISNKELLQQLLDFVKENDRLPTFCDNPSSEERKLYRLVCERIKNLPEVKELWKQYCKSLRISYEERVAMLQDFVAKNGRLPGKYDEEYKNLAQLQRINKKKNDPVLNELFEKYSMIMTTEQLKQAVLDFYAKHGHLPRNTNGLPKEETNLRAKFWKRRDELYSDPEIAALLATRKREVPQEVKIVTMMEFTAKHGRKPLPADGDKLYQMWHTMLIGNKKLNDPRVNEMYEKYGDRKNMPLEDYIAPLADFIHSEKRLPSTHDKDENILYSILKNLKIRYTDHPKVKPLLEEIDKLPKRATYIARNDKRTKQQILEFVNEYHRLPKHTIKEEKNLADNWAARRDRLCAEYPEMQAIRDQYEVRPPKFEERYARVRDWSAEHGRLPRRTDKEEGLYHDYITLRDTYRSTPEVQALLKKYGSVLMTRVDIDARLDQIEAFADERGRLPTTAHSDEVQLGRWWVNLKKHNGTHPRVTALKARFPIQNKK